MTAKPFHVLKVVNAPKLAAHYEYQDERSRVDLSHLREQAAQIRAEGSSESREASYATRADADAEAARRNATTSLPGISYRAEYLDVDEDWWTS
jgi:hypothetical protein